jgi:hypothetical protein
VDTSTSTGSITQWPITLPSRELLDGSWTATFAANWSGTQTTLTGTAQVQGTTTLNLTTSQRGNGAPYIISGTVTTTASSTTARTPFPCLVPLDVLASKFFTIICCFAGLGSIVRLRKAGQAEPQALVQEIPLGGGTLRIGTPPVAGQSAGQPATQTQSVGLTAFMSRPLRSKIEGIMKRGKVDLIPFVGEK